MWLPAIRDRQPHVENHGGAQNTVAFSMRSQYNKSKRNGDIYLNELTNQTDFFPAWEELNICNDFLFGKIIYAPLIPLDQEGISIRFRISAERTTGSYLGMKRVKSF